MSRDRDRRRFWRDRDSESWQCPHCGRTRDATDRVDVHHRDENSSNGHPGNLRGRCKHCHLGGEHDRDVERDPRPRPRRTGPPTPSLDTP